MKKLAIPSDQRSSWRRGKRLSRNGLTIIELLVAVTLTLIIILAMIRAFKTSSEQIRLGRAKMDMHNKLRVVTEQLRRDLQNMTRTPNPLSTTDGYFEYVEGEENDADHATTALSFLSDHDDLLALTVRSQGTPFIGRWVNPATGGTEQVESHVAEVVWWVVHDDTNSSGDEDYDDQYRLYRRVLLIRPDLAINNPTDTFVNFYQDNDIAVRREAGDLVPNSLEDLANRANRFAHDSGLFPHEFIVAGAGSIFNRAYNNADEGQDLMLDNCVGFDIKIYDPTAQVFTSSAAGVPASYNIGQTLEFDDAGFAAVSVDGTVGAANIPAAYPQAGGYVNLGYDPSGASVMPVTTGRWFADLSDTGPNNGYTYANNPRTYCTWWDGYERNGVDDDGVDGIDQGVDGIDTDGINGIDDNGERETRPPYAYPARSIQVTVRMIEKKSNQVLQKSVRESFVPN